MKLLIALFFLFSLVGFNSNAQEVNGVLVNTQLDSINSKFIFPLTNTTNNEYILMDNGTGKIKIPATQILSLIVDDTKYVSVKVNDSYYIAKCISCDGFLSRMRYKPLNESQYSVELLRKMDGASIEVPTFGFKSIISDFLGDCPETLNQLTELKYRRSKLDSLIISYNNCKLSNLENFTDTDEFTDAVSIVENSTDITDKNKSELIDILNSIKSRKAKNEDIPNYLINSLKDLTTGKTIEKEIKTLIKSIKN